MAELTISTDEVVGIKKEIDEGAYDLIFQALQEDIYSFPIKSFVRETISNSLDAAAERRIAEAILYNNEPVDNYYRQEHDDKLLKDSAWDPSYFKLEHLSSDDHVKVKYKEGATRDTISISDRGVGLGNKRLKGWFKIGYSSKRNMRGLYGKFGMGAKAGLATGIEYFTMTTWYNGYKSSFMVFKHDYDPMTQEHPEGKKEVWKVTMADGKEVEKIIYWEPTTRKNGVKVTLPVKKHNKNAFLSAVRQQFSYFRGQVILTYPYNNGSGYGTDKLDGTPLYESDTILIPESSPYSIPHIIVDGINYGPISWQELELENRQGRFGLKVKANDVDITQSREALKWTDKTKKVVLDGLKAAKKEAASYISSVTKTENNSANVFKRIHALFQTAKSSENEVARTFSTFLNIIELIPEITIPEVVVNNRQFRASLDNTTFRQLFYYYKLVLVSSTTTRNGVIINRSQVTSFENLPTNIVFASKTGMGEKISLLMFDEFDSDSFLYIRPYNRDYVQKIHGVLDAEHILHKYIQMSINGLAVNLDERTFSFKEKEEEKSETIVHKEAINWAAIRKRNAETLYRSYTMKEEHKYVRGEGWNDVYEREMDKETLRIRSIPDRFDKNTIVCTQEHKHLASMLEYYNSQVSNTRERFTILHISKEALKHFLPTCTYITEYLKTYNPKTKSIMVGEAFRNLNTLNKTKQLLESSSEYFVKNNTSVVKLLTSMDFIKYIRAVDSSPSTLKEELARCYIPEDILTSVLGYLDQLAQVQDVIGTESDDTIAKMTKELLGGEILHVNAYDKEFYDELKIELDRLIPLGPILNNVNSSISNPEEFITLVNKILPLIS